MGQAYNAGATLLSGFVSQDILDRILDATDILALVGQQVPLKRSGQNHKGLCPFHNEKTPSFFVSPQRQTFKCFGCGIGGNAFSFVMEHEHCSFPEAVQMLAERSGITVPTSAPTGLGRDARLGLEQLLKRTAELYARALHAPQGEPARAYLAERQISDESIGRWTLGFAPDGWSFLLDKATQKGTSTKDLEQAGLVLRAQDSGHTYDRFRNRLMFPIDDVRGRMLGFGARCLDGSEPKYINSPQTTLFDKSRCLYGVFQAKQSIAQRRQVIIVEGYTDVIMAHQCGVGNVVATLGTALTRQHIDLLRRFSDEAVLVFDADTAGAKASDRSMELFIEREFPVRLATLPAGQDPCDYCLQNGGPAFGEKIEEARSLYVYKIDQAAQLNDASPRERAEAIDELLRLVSMIPGSVERRIQLDDVVRSAVIALGVDERSLRRRYVELLRANRRRTRETSEEPPSVRQDAPPAVEAKLVGLALADEASLARLADELAPDELTDDRLTEVYSCIIELYRNNGKVEARQVVSAAPHLAAMVVDLEESSRRAGNFEQNLEGALKRWKMEQVKRERLSVKQRMKLADQEENTDLLRQLAQKYQDLYRRYHDLNRQM